jgi:uncharacterized protein (DUF1501 family)
MNQYRRNLLKALMGLPLASSGSLLFSSPAWSMQDVQESLANAPGIASDKPNFIFIFLRGAADTLNMLAPYSDSYYHEARPTLGLSKEQCLPVSSEFGIHPLLKDSFYTNYKNGNAIFIPMSGQKDTTRSHFESQDNFEGGCGIINNESGFLGRLTEVLGCQTVSFTENLTPVCASQKIVIPNQTFKPVNIHLDSQEISQINNEYQDNARLKSIFDISVKNKGIHESNASGLKYQTKMDKIAVYMRNNNTTLAFMDILNWDTHAQEGILRGRMPEVLNNLNAEISAYQQAATPAQWNNTLIMVATEFGRMVHQNGTGTDHGHGSLLSFFGGMITQSKIEGEWMPLKNENLFENRDVQMIHEYRDVLSQVFSKMYGINKSQQDYVFPGSNAVSFNII